MQARLACDAVSLLLDPIQRRHEDGHQQGENGDDNEQLNKRETWVFPHDGIPFCQGKGDFCANDPVDVRLPRRTATGRPDRRPKAKEIRGLRAALAAPGSLCHWVAETYSVASAWARWMSSM